MKKDKKIQQNFENKFVYNEKCILNMESFLALTVKNEFWNFIYKKNEKIIHKLPNTNG